MVVAAFGLWVELELGVEAVVDVAVVVVGTSNTKNQIRRNQLEFAEKIKQGEVNFAPIHSGVDLMFFSYFSAFTM